MLYLPAGTNMLVSILLQLGNDAALVNIFEYMCVCKIYYTFCSCACTCVCEHLELLDKAQFESCSRIVNVSYSSHCACHAHNVYDGKSAC